ncbi:rod shape-determining protein RodA [Candidatus Curtissbacteria bacterium]|nr:rod shape-determining protein RodA [Candidatus Curtissbacteria bacterium]
MTQKWDFSLLLLILAIGSISLLVIFAINPNLAKTQMIFWLIGLFLLVAFSFFDFRNWQKLSIPIYLASILTLLVLPFIGESVRGSTRWIDLGFFRIQPSEIAKVASIFILSSYYLSRSARKFQSLIVSFLIVSPHAVLVLIQPDIGNALAFFAIWLGISYAAGFQVKHLVWTIVIAAIAAILAYEFLAPYQKERIAGFIDPQADPLGRGYNLIQSKIAVGAGQLTGKGLGQGSQSQLNFLPEAESDFIFASIAEQLGFIGAGLLIVFYISLIIKILNLVKKKERFAQLLIIGTVSFLLLQFFVNVGMNMGLVPVTGITLPLVSYGGSSLITTLFLMGIIFSIKRLAVED